MNTNHELKARAGNQLYFIYQTSENWVKTKISDSLKKDGLWRLFRTKWTSKDFDFDLAPARVINLFVSDAISSEIKNLEVPDTEKLEKEYEMRLLTDFSDSIYV